MKISFRLSAKTNQVGMCELLLTGKKRCGAKVVTMRAKSELLCSPEFFSETLGIDVNRKRVCATESKTFHLAQREKLDKMIAHIASVEFDTEEFGSEWLQNTVHSYLHPVKVEKSNKKQTFQELAEDYLNNMQTSEVYKRNFAVVIRLVCRFTEFKKIEDKNFVFDVEQVDEDMLCDLRDYMRHESEFAEEYPKQYAKIFKSYPNSLTTDRKVEERGANTISRRFRDLRVMWHRWNELGIVKNDPFKTFQNTQEQYGDVVYLTLEEREKIENTPMPTKHLETQRDIFIAHCRIGCRVSDLMRLRPEHIHNGMLVYTPNKTKDETARIARVPVREGLQRLIDKYSGTDRKGRLFPCISAQRYNDAIKEILTIAEVTRMVEIRDSLTGQNVLRPINEIASSHMARRTFVANLYNKVADPTIISQMSGHTANSKAFSRYRKQEDSLLHEVIALVD